jgi:hypothetical protein
VLSSSSSAVFLTAFFFIAHKCCSLSVIIFFFDNFKCTNKRKFESKTRLNLFCFFFPFVSSIFFSPPQKVILLWSHRKIHDIYILHLILNEDKWLESARQTPFDVEIRLHLEACLLWGGSVVDQNEYYDRKCLNDEW